MFFDRVFTLQVQVSNKERQQNLSVLFKDVATLVVEKCINAETKQALTISQVETAMKECHVALNPNNSAKQQALKVIKILEEKSSLKIERAKMRLQVDTSPEGAKDLREKVADQMIVESTTELKKETETEKALVRLVVLIVPAAYRTIELAMKEKGGKIEVLTHCVKPESNETF